MKKYLRAFLVLVVATFSFSFATQSNAATSTNTSDAAEKYEKQAQYIEENSEALTNKELDKVVQVVQDNIKSDDIKVQGNADKLDYDNAHGYKFNETAKNVTAIVIPYMNNSSNEVSSLNTVTIALDKDLKVEEYSEVKVSETSTTATGTVYVNGEEMGTHEVDKSHDTKPGTITTMGYVDDVNACMKRFGIQPSTAALALSVCGTVCGVTAGALCIPCLGTIGAAGGGVIAGCMINP